MVACSMEYILRVMHIIQTDATVLFVSARGMMFDCVTFT